MPINAIKCASYVKWEQFFGTSDIRLLFYLHEHEASRFSELLKFIEKDKKSNKRSMLSRSLRDMQERKLIERKVEQKRPVETRYQLTNRGIRAVELLMELQKVVQ